MLLLLLLLLLKINKTPEGLNSGFTVAGKIIASKEANSAANPNPYPFWDTVACPMFVFTVFHVQYAPTNTAL